jgi:DNA-binding NarL/FixJ family response regulator
MAQGEIMKILVVDDHALVREGLRQVLRGLDEQIEVLEAPACARAFELADLHPDLDLVLMDYMMPDLNGLLGLEAMGKRHPELPVVMLTGSADPQLEARLLARGAAGFLSKGGNSQEMLRLLRQVLDGEDPRPRAAAATATQPSANDAAKPAPHLTQRQEAVLAMLLAGASNKTISRELYISDETTRNHVSAILRFFGVESRIQAVLAAGRAGYTAAPPSSESSSPF